MDGVQVLDVGARGGGAQKNRPNGLGPVRGCHCVPALTATLDRSSRDPTTSGPMRVTSGRAGCGKAACADL